jgi:hypothetical protein
MGRDEQWDKDKESKRRRAARAYGNRFVRAPSEAWISISAPGRRIRSFPVRFATCCGEFSASRAPLCNRALSHPSPHRVPHCRRGAALPESSLRSTRRAHNTLVARTPHTRRTLTARSPHPTRASRSSACLPLPRSAARFREESRTAKPPALGPRGNESPSTRSAAHRLGDRVHLSLNIGGTPRKASAASLIRVHHDAVDQAMLVTRPNPPEGMTHML